MQAEYKYDFAGRQAIRKLNATPVRIHSVFDSENRRMAEYNEAPGALIREYVWLGWDPIAVIEGGVVSFIRADHIGRPVFATNATAAKVWTASYLPFGGVRTTTGIPISARFPGQWFQSESGLHQNWMRDYDPTTGRYVEADPLGLIDGASIYGYARGNPGRWTDPMGLWTANGGVSGGFHLGWVGIVFEFGITVDGCGNAGIYFIGGAGPQFTDIKSTNFRPSGGKGANISVTVGGSNAKTICDLEGRFDNVAFNIGDGEDIGANAYHGDSPHGKVTGGGGNVGVGLGDSFWAGQTYTWIPIKAKSNCDCECN